jgi:hypothetical protein
MEVREPNRVAAMIVTVLFAAMLLTPAALALTGHAGVDEDFIYNTEMRKPFVAPSATTGALATGGWERDVERQIGDAFPFRRRLIEAYDIAKYRWLDDVGSSHLIRGSGGWLFYGEEERAYIDGTFNPSERELVRLGEVYRARAAWCAERHITYLLLLVPNKSTVYREFLPPGVRYAEPTPAARLVKYLRTHGVRAIYPRDELRRASRDGAVYSKGDSHWNDAGAFVASRAVVAALRDVGFRDAVEARALRAERTWTSGDLDRIAGIADAVRNEVTAYDFPRRATPSGAPEYRGDPLAGHFQPAVFSNPGARGPSAMLFGDSFSDALRRFLAEDVSRLVVMRRSISDTVQFDHTAISQERPAVVIDELVERALFFGDRFTP